MLTSGDRPKKKQCLTYGELASLLQMSHHRPLRFVLHKIQDECRIKGFPILTTLVVTKAKGIPGEGCDSHELAAFEETLTLLGSVNWPAEAWW